MVGLLVPSNDPNLLRSTGTAAQSPFVIAATLAGIKVVPSIINFVVLTSAWSAGNSGQYPTSIFHTHTYLYLQVSSVVPELSTEWLVKVTLPGFSFEQIAWAFRMWRSVLSVSLFASGI
jgi:hypothetical protein